jgi:alpha-methylacyl-CoA racemase
VDTCVTPVLSFDEASRHPHLAARRVLVSIGGIVQPAPAPRFSRTVPGTPSGPPASGADNGAVLADWQA